jgi:hypothetical protein
MSQERQQEVGQTTDFAVEVDLALTPHGWLRPSGDENPSQPSRTIYTY